VLQIIDEEKFIQFLGQLGKLRSLPLITISSPLCKEYGLSEEHITALAKIVMMDDPFVSYIASGLNITTSKASRLIKYLEEIKHPEKGNVKLVQRKYDEVGDRRKIKLEPTQEGKELYGKLWSDLLQFYEEIVKEVGEEEISKLTSLLKKFNSVAEEKIKIHIDPEAWNDG